MHLDRRLVRLASTEKGLLLLSVSASVAAAAATVGGAAALAATVARVFLGGQNLRQVEGLLLLLGLAAVLKASFTWLAAWSAGRAAIDLGAVLRQRLAERMVTAGPLLLGHEQSGELATALGEGVRALDPYIRDYLPQLARTAMIPLLVLAFVASRDPLSGVVLLLTAPVIPVFMVLIGRVAEAMGRRRWEALSRMSARFLDALQGLTTLKLFGRARDQVELIAQVTGRFRHTTMEVLRVAFLSALVLELVATLSTAVVAVEVGLRLLYGHMSFQPAFLILLLAPEFYLPFRRLGSHFHAGLEGVAAADRLMELSELPPAVSTTGGRSPEPSGVPRLRLENVSFSYPARNGGEPETAPALRGVSFELPPGERIALVGPSGAGKSTLARLILRFADPNEGRITADRIDLRELSPDAWRSRVAWVPQRPHLFAGTVAENIRLTRPEASMEAVRRAAASARVDELIDSLPQGYDTPIGEGGLRLSGGQAQRLALARAFLKDAPILILDEVTSQLDPELEADLMEATSRLMEGRSVLIIAHRLATVRSADRIIVLRAGRVVESGTHHELVERGGLYAALLAPEGSSS
ncbi:MAG TPA: thiol reductant ABC exporter subunit CydD [Acidobacteria bacterium]|nr:thiol reductant ABC exporter subunit CydD [Acidobacteriota bacterium]